MLRVLRVQNAATLEGQEAFLTRAFASTPFFAPYSELKADLEFMVEDPHFIVLLGLWKEKPVGLVIASLPRSKMQLSPQVTLFYNEGPRRVARAMTEAGHALLEEAGYRSFWALNLSRADDALWQRTFSAAGQEAHKLGSLMEFSW